MARFEEMKGLFGLLPTPYNEDYSILTSGADVVIAMAPDRTSQKISVK